MWSTFLPTINIGYDGHTVPSIVYDETDDGSYLFCVKADKPWADDLLAATHVTVTRNVTRAAATQVVAEEPTGDVRAGLWKDHIKQLRRLRTGSESPDPDLRLILLTPRA